MWLRGILPYSWDVYMMSFYKSIFEGINSMDLTINSILNEEKGMHSIVSSTYKDELVTKSRGRVHLES